MRISEMRAREDFDTILVKTLTRSWTDWLGIPTTVSLDRRGPGQPWRVQPLLNAYYVSELGKPPRRFLRDTFRYTPFRRRAVPQFVFGSVLGSSRGLQHLSSSGFKVHPRIAAAGDLLVIPGNHRLRIFDFGRGTVRVVLKSGFPRAFMDRELDVRGPGQTGPFVSVTKVADDRSWFEEPIFQGHSLPRCPPWRSRAQAETRAFSLLDEWLRTHARTVDASTHAATLGANIRRALHGVHQRFGADVLPEVALDGLLEAAGRLGRISLSRSHGDFQPGNIFVGPQGKVSLLDWEHSALRFEHYDHMVYGLSCRWSRAYLEPLWAFAQGRPTGQPILDGLRSDRAWRLASCALFLLEELLWHAEESDSSAYASVLEGLREHCALLARLGPGLGLLQRSTPP